MVLFPGNTDFLIIQAYVKVHFMSHQAAESGEISHMLRCTAYMVPLVHYLLHVQYPQGTNWQATLQNVLWIKWVWQYLFIHW